MSSDTVNVIQILENELLDHQKQIARDVYNSTKIVVETFDNTLDSSIRITKTIGAVVKSLETIKINIPGSDKKIIALKVSRTLLDELVSNKEILELYDIIAEPILETLIDVSKTVNTIISEASIHCCLNFLGKRKNSSGRISK